MYITIQRNKMSLNETIQSNNEQKRVATNGFLIFKLNQIHFGNLFVSAFFKACGWKRKIF